jgi:integrase
LVIRFFVATGMREQEVAHTEWSDINWIAKTVRVQAKPHYDWKPKTKAGTRTIPLPDALLADLKVLKAKATSSLVFPAARGGVEFHFLRIFQELGEKAGVPGVKCRKFRDTYISDKIQEGVDLNTVRVWIGHTNFDTLKLYAQALQNKDQRAREAANRQERYTLTAVAAD